MSNPFESQSTMPESRKTKTTKEETPIKQNIVSGLDRLEEAAGKEGITQPEVRRMLNLLREKGPLADDPDREKMLEKLNLMAPEEIEKIKAHDEEVRKGGIEKTENSMKLNIIKGLDRIEKTKKEEISKREVRTILNLLREDGPLANDSDRKNLLKRANNINIPETEEKKD